MSNPVFRLDEDAAGTVRADPSAAAGRVLPAAPEESRHALKVMRLAPGEPVDLVDGTGLRLRGTVADQEGTLGVEVAEVLDERSDRPRITLVQALAKGERDLLSVETCTELGVDAVVPWQADRSIVRWKADRAAKSRAKWVSTVTAAAKQSRRSAWPEVGPLHTTAQLVDAVAGADLVLVLHERAAVPLTSLVAELGLARWARERPGADVRVLVGPEGGISDEELDRLVAAGARPVLLGSTVLRSSTAGPAALAVLSTALQRW